jgi:hypothetical protein
MKAEYLSDFKDIFENPRDLFNGLGRKRSMVRYPN